jgi:UDP-N-acetylglucosamine transferase subunit ALG13
MLSKNILNNVRYTGILSRFGTFNLVGETKYEIVAIVSGPEPQRTIFENSLRNQLKATDQKSILIKGKPGSVARLENGLVTEVDHLNSEELESVLVHSSVVIARSGYSSIMDLATLGKKVIFVPTPGQTEQEYLGEYVGSKHIAIVQNQAEFNLREALANLSTVSNLPTTSPNSLLSGAVHSLCADASNFLKS